MEFGIQMWGYSEWLWAYHGPAELMDHFVRCGYAIIEPDVWIDATDEETMPSKAILFDDQVDDFYKMIASRGMRLDSVHVFGSILKNVDKLNNWRKDFGIRAVVHGVSDGPEDMDKRAECFMAEAEALSDIGLELWLHNVGGDTVAGADGSSQMETLLRRCGGKVFAQLDLGWAMFDGHDPVEFMNSISAYLRSVHYKDLKLHGIPERMHTVLGSGDLDVADCWEAARKLPVTQLIDQDESQSSMYDDARTGLLLLKYLELRSKLADAGIE